MISLVGQWLRYRTSRREFNARIEAERARADAEREREQNLALLDRLDHLSQHDPLTELANRRRFDQALAREVARADQEGSALALVLLDIDHFKALNDTLGHQAGDGVLRVVASALAARVRAEDLPARYGGEEFALILPGVRAEDVVPLVDQLRHTVHEATHADGCPMAVTVSAGAAVYPRHAQNSDDLVRVADVALYAAKAAGRDRTHVADPIGASRSVDGGRGHAPGAAATPLP
jgi:diguanylate cyclase (GGDEF)-like protein